MWFLHPPQSRRRWHLFTWLAVVPAVVFVALVQVAGIGDEEHLASHGDVFEARVTYQHGWPLPWAERSLDYRLEGATLFGGMLGPVVNEASGELLTADWPTELSVAWGADWQVGEWSYLV